MLDQNIARSPKQISSN